MKELSLISRTFYCLLLLLIAGQAQAISYQFSASSGSYTPNAGTNIWTTGDDSYTSTPINIGFTFNFGGCTTTPYTQVKVSTNGWLSLGTGATGFQSGNDMAWSSYGPLLAPLWDDLAIGTGGNVNYSTTGAVGSRVFTVEWLNMKWGWSAGSAGVSFQVKLYEATGTIQYIYRQEAGSLTSPTASIGINGGASTDFYSLNNTSASPAAVYGTATNNLNAKPATGQIYTWSLPSTMAYTSSSVTQASTADVYPNTINNEITGVQVVVSGACTPFNLTQLLINMNGTTSVADVTNIDVYYTGNSSTYAPTTLFGSVAPGPGTLTVNGTQALQNGTNYFWIVYDVAAAATLGNFLDAECTQITMDGGVGNRIPTGNPPTGSRPIVVEPSSFAKWIELGWAKSVVEASGSTGLVWAGQTSNTYSSGSSDAYIIKTNYDLSTIYWTSAVGFASGSERINDIVETSDGFVGVGYTTSVGAGGWDIFVVKINTSGAVQWTQTIGTASTDEGHSIILTSDGNVAICGVRGDVSDGYFAKIDNATGAILAQRSISALGSTVFRTIIQTSDGGFLMGGNTNNDFYLVKLTSAFAFDWGRRWGGANNDYITFLSENSLNDYTIGGYSYSYGAGSSDGYIMRFSWTGAPTVTWVNAYGTADGNTYNDGVKNADGSYTMSGITTRLGDPLNNEAFIAKISSAGSLIFAKSIGTTTASEDEEGYGIASLADGSYASAGLHNSAIGPNFYMLKIAGSGYSCSSIQDNGGITSLIAPAFTTDGSISTPAFASTGQTSTNNTGGIIVGGCGNLLSVELLYLTGYNDSGNNIIEWATASEKNNSFFVVESSADNTKWQAIGTLKGAGNSSAKHRYSFTDHKPHSSVTYYRLKQLGADGTQEYSETIVVKTKNNFDESFTLYPNPAHDNLTISLNSEEQNIHAKIVDVYGQVVVEKTFDNTGEKLLNVSQLPAGVYVVNVSGNAYARNQKFVKK